VFTKATIHLENGRDFVLEAPKASHDVKYIRSISVDGAPAASALVPLKHADIAKGARVVVDMSDRPTR
jgi:putative alpha-1,2-mannosidase